MKRLRGGACSVVSGQAFACTLNNLGRWRHVDGYSTRGERWKSRILAPRLRRSGAALLTEMACSPALFLMADELLPSSLAIDSSGIPAAASSRNRRTSCCDQGCAGPADFLFKVDTNSPTDDSEPIAQGRSPWANGPGSTASIRRSSAHTTTRCRGRPGSSWGTSNRQ